jgi:EAL domain-containing protein (putative c-di-GMP-specific phosphodiesterase class I)
VVSLANALALDLVVEGVETVAEHDALVAMGARKGQGFLYARPMEFDDAYELLRSGAKCAVPHTSTLA